MRKSAELLYQVGNSRIPDGTAVFDPDKVYEWIKEPCRECERTIVGGRARPAPLEYIEGLMPEFSDALGLIKLALRPVAESLAERFKGVATYGTTWANKRRPIVKRTGKRLADDGLLEVSPSSAIVPIPGVGTVRLTKPPCASCGQRSFQIDGVRFPNYFGENQTPVDCRIWDGGRKHGDGVLLTEKEIAGRDMFRFGFEGGDCVGYVIVSQAFVDFVVERDWWGWVFTEVGEVVP